MRSMLITGGAGFIGVNAAAFFGRRGWKISILDNLSRRGARENLSWLSTEIDFSLQERDVRDLRAAKAAVSESSPHAVLHLAAQVAVTTSLIDPLDDFENNARGTLNVLEAIRGEAPEATLLYSSTNKVYGDLGDLCLEERTSRWAIPGDEPGISEERSLAFHSPYGCSKGAADQYVLDYTESYGLKGLCLRQSCIYGPRQFGIEDQGWVAWFIIAAKTGRAITVYGDGKQVRDVLFVEDLCELYEAAIATGDRAIGEAFNIGGGIENSLSLREFLSILEAELGTGIDVGHAEWRRGDQRYFVSNNGKAKRLLKWEPRTGCREGIGRLARWVDENRELFRA